jgi:hypothetical protein
LQHNFIKCWDYYGVMTPERFFSATIADPGYAGQSFVYTVDFAHGVCHEATVTILVLKHCRDNAPQHVCYNITPSQRSDILAAEPVISSTYLQGA